MENFVNTNEIPGGQADMTDSNSVSIGIASPEEIRHWSRGEIKNPETINYRTHKPEKGGLFCEKIFGPVNDYECACGQYKRQKYKGVICEKCGVEVTEKAVRRERMGHIELAVPVSHIWFFKCSPSRLAMLIGMGERELEEVLYYQKYIVIDPKDATLQRNQTLDDKAYAEAVASYGKDGFEAGMGAEAIEKVIRKLCDVSDGHDGLVGERDRMMEALRNMRNTGSTLGQNYVRRIRLLEGFIKHNMDPCWMILHVLPVIPPDLRPLVPLPSGRYANSDLNDLYRRVINRNNRLKNLLTIPTPEVIIRNEKRMLQEAVDALLNNGRHGRAVTGSGNRALKSLTDMLKGKQGRFRQNLLGKRVDYSGRSVIVVGPELNINQCGLPKEMAIKLFEPFIMRRLIEKYQVHSSRNARKYLTERRKEVWEVLDSVVSGHPIMLNRAPTLHRISIQAFDPILIDGQAIRLHPLVCAAFNADFDGDQMAVHVPLSNEAQMEAKLIMLAQNNVFSPASGKPLTVPSQDMVLGIYYLCYEDVHRRKHFEEIRTAKEKLKADLEAKKISKAKFEEEWAKLPMDFRFDDYKEVLRAMETEVPGKMVNGVRARNAAQLHIHDFIYFKNPYYRSPEEVARIAALPKDEQAAIKAEDSKMVWGNRTDKYIITTAGRCIFHEIWPAELGFWNDKTLKKDIQKMIKQCYENCGRAAMIPLLDTVKNLGYYWATRAGFSISIDDMLVPSNKQQLIDDANERLKHDSNEKEMGKITEGERRQRSINTWTEVRDKLKDELKGVLADNRGRAEINPVGAMLESGARGSADQVGQLGCMRGLMADTSGNVLETPILHNFREGLTGLEYFNSTHGSRKGMADTALKTADAGYMTRRLVDVAHDVICTMEDCGSSEGIEVEGITAGDNKLTLDERIAGRFAAADVFDDDMNLLVANGEEITVAKAKQIVEAGITKVRIRSALTCTAPRGICAKCYGRHLATGEMPMEGDALGIIAAQSIGEPGTQLTLRTFHSGGTASGGSAEKEIKASWDHYSRELQKKLDELEETATRKKWPEKKLADERKALLERENKCFIVNDGIEVTTGGKAKGEITRTCTSRGDAKYKLVAAYFNKKGEPVMSDDDLASIRIPYGARLKLEDNALVSPGAVLAEIDPFNDPIIAKQAGYISYRQLVAGTNGTITITKGSGSDSQEVTVVEHGENVHPALAIMEKKRDSIERGDAPLVEESVGVVGTKIMVKDGQKIDAGDIIAQIPHKQEKTNDITTGLPRVAELFDARRPRESAVLSPIDAYVTFAKGKNKKNTLLLVDCEQVQPEWFDGINADSDMNAVAQRLKEKLKSEEISAIEVSIPTSKHVIVNEGAAVARGDVLTDGVPVLEDILHICGPEAAQHYLVDSVQKVYQSQGVTINDKHIEIIVRQMMRKYKIKDAKGTTFLNGEAVDKRVFDETNAKAVANGREPAQGEPMIQGITKACLTCESFISAASFQDTPRILTDAATHGATDFLHGFKENVIMGHLIPAGTGYYKVRNPRLLTVDEDGQETEITDSGSYLAALDNNNEDDKANSNEFGDEFNSNDTFGDQTNAAYDMPDDIN